MGFVYHTARALTGGASTALDAFTTASLTDSNTHVCFTYDSATSKIYAHVFDSTATDAESSPDVIRPDDYATAGVWLMQNSPVDSEVETGSVRAWLTETAPTGYLECDGSAISRSTYATLFAIIGDTYGVGDGVNTFNLPDFRGEFLRGWDHGAGNDPDAASRTDSGDGTTGDHVGTQQADAIKAHTHNYYSGQNGSGYDYAYADQISPVTRVTSSTGGNETRPRNVAVMWIIKY